MHRHRVTVCAHSKESLQFPSLIYLLRAFVLSVVSISSPKATGYSRPFAVQISFVFFIFNLRKFAQICGSALLVAASGCSKSIRGSG